MYFRYNWDLQLRLLYGPHRAHLKGYFMIDSLAVHVKDIFAVRGRALRGVGEAGILEKADCVRARGAGQ
jgi:hypothetical protein